MGEASQTTVRRLSGGDEDVVRRLADREPQTALLQDDATIFLAAFDGEEPVGFVFGYELPRRHGDPSILFVYELEVEEGYRRRGIAMQLMNELRRAAPRAESFVLAEPDNDAANAAYASLGGVRSEVVMWDFPSVE